MIGYEIFLVMDALDRKVWLNFKTILVDNQSEVSGFPEGCGRALEAFTTLRKMPPCYF